MALVCNRLVWIAGGPELTLAMAPRERLYLGGASAAVQRLILALGGFVPVLSGRLEIEGRDIAGAAPPERHIAYLPAGDTLLPWRTLLGNLAVAAPGRSAAEHRDSLRLLGLEGAAHRRVERLGRAERRLGALARALAASPSLLLVEEGEDGTDLADRLATLEGPPAIVACPDPAVALARADRILLLAERRLAQLGTPQDIYRHPADSFAARWSGDCNLLSATLLGPGGSDGLAAARIGAHVVGCRPRSLPSPHALLAIRPHTMRLDPAGLPATLRRIDFRGATTRLVARLDDDQSLCLDTAEPQAGLAPGQRIGLAWHAEDAWPVPAF